MCSSKAHMLKHCFPAHWYLSIWGLWEVMRSWRQSHCDKINVPVRRDTRDFSLSFCHVGSQWNGDCPWTRKGAFARNLISHWLGLGLPCFHYCEKKPATLCVINSASYNLSLISVFNQISETVAGQLFSLQIW